MPAEFQVHQAPRTLVDSLVRAEACEPSLSIFLPTFRRATEARQSCTRFRALIRDVRTIMTFRRVEAQTIETLAAALERVAGDSALWSHPDEGLAIFLSPAAAHIARWPLPFEESVTVDRRFHILPLLAQMEGDDTFYHLTLTPEMAQLTHGNRQGWEDVPLELDDPSYRAYRLQAGRPPSAARLPLSGAKAPERDEALLGGYLRTVAQAVSAHVQERDRPLVLSGDEGMIGLFRKIADEKQFHPILIAHHANILNESEVHRQALALLAPTFDAPLHDALARRDVIAGTKADKVLSGIENVVRAARAGVIDTLFVPSSSEAFGYFWPERDEVRLGFVPESHSSEDLINTAAIFTLRHGGRVFALPPRAPRLAVAQAILRHAA